MLLCLNIYNVQIFKGFGEFPQQATAGRVSGQTPCLQNFKSLASALKFERNVTVSQQYNSKDIASFVRNRVLNGKTVVESIPSKDEVISEIKQVGNNINQIARKLNSLSKNTVATKQDMLQAKLLAKQCLEEQKKLYKMISKKLYIIHEEVTDYDSYIQKSTA